jgi:hypothetical protein
MPSVFYLPSALNPLSFHLTYTYQYQRQQFTQQLPYQHLVQHRWR